MPQKATLPEGFEPDVPEGFEPDVKPHVSRGASGTWAGGFNDERTPAEIRQDQSAAVIRGIPNAVINLPGAAVEAAKAGYEGLKGNVKPLGEMAVGVTRPFVTAAKGAAALAVTHPVLGPDIRDASRRMGINVDKYTEAPSAEEFQQASESAGENLGGIYVGEAIGAMAPAVARRLGAKIPVPDRLRYAQDRNLVFTEPEGHLTRALKPDLDPDGIRLAGEQLKAGEAKIGKPVKDVDSARAAAKAQFEQELMPLRRSIIDPQRTVVVPKSRRALIKAKIAAIPKDILPGTREHTGLVNDIMSSIPADLTIGQLEDITTSLNSQNRAYHQAKLGQALSKLENARGAIDVATEGTARNLMQEGMDLHGLGGADKLRQVNQRIGSLIRLEDAIDAAERSARTEAALPFFRRGIKGTTVNEGIANAMRLWKSSSPYIQSGPGFGPASRARLLPSSTSTNLGPSPDTSSVTGSPAIYSPPGRPRMITQEAGSPHAMGTGEPVPGTGPSSVTGEASQLAKGPFTGKPLVGKEGRRLTVPNVPIKKGVPLETTYEGGAVQPNLYGLSQTVDLKMVPPGTKLSFETKLADGTKQWHYITPDGTMIISDAELNLSKVNKNRPYEPGSSWAGSPYEGPTPPPKKRTKRRL